MGFPPRQLPALALLFIWLITVRPVNASDGTAVSSDADVNFNRDVRPILAKRCITCHGPDADAREADLRLDIESGSRADLGGYQAVVPGDASQSEMIVRITTDDEDLRMPPADSHAPLTQDEVAILTRWIAAGGRYEQHWSFVAPTKPAVPQVDDAAWCRNPIDRFVLAKLERSGLQPSAPATREALIRRVSMDLIGRPPSIDEVDRLLGDESPDAYERLVDRLLATQEYAERFTRPWLDLARYSDTNGYEKDRERTMWPYRDWVISAINQDMPFDQFSIEQLAGDMLSDATTQQIIATGFHRNTMLNEEGGIDPLEYRFYAMVDRVATTGTVWMGLTTGCAQCHTHKYDPITHTDYYALMALMDNADEPELDADSAEITAKRKQVQSQIASQEQLLLAEIFASDTRQHQTLRDHYAAWRATQIESATDWQTVRPTDMKSTMPHLRVTPQGSILASGDATKRDEYELTFAGSDQAKPLTAVRIEVLPHESLPASGPGMAYYEGRRGDFFLSKLTIEQSGNEVALDLASSSYGNISVGSGKADAANVLDTDNSTGWSTAGKAGEANRLVVHFAEPLDASKPWTLKLLFERHFVAALGHFRVDVTDASGQRQALPISSELESSLATNAQPDSNAEQRLQLHFLRNNEAAKSVREPLDRLRKQLPAEVRTLVMRERSPADQRETRRRHRGEYLSEKEVVSGAVPVMFTADDEESNSACEDRLDLARWLVSEDNPLVGRVVVNRQWREFFGVGIVRTAGDFGTQSESPSHQELLDWLDRDLRDSGWSLKRLHRMIVTSATYQQRIGTPPPSDPDNRLLSTFSHRRYDAERIRDAMLAASGLLTHRVGGPSVYPPQPAAVQQIAYGNPNWPTSKGGDRYRRSLYTFSKRTAPFAAFSTFDGPSGENCVARRDRSTTPLQALTLLNDEMYVEIAAALAEKVQRELKSENANPIPEQIVERMFRRLMTRSPEPWEIERIVQFYQQQQQHQNAWTLVARALMNTDEAITTP
ncbi:PSD1 and planctomycete cytochrome C domain-containing protein [Stieleria varia]|uniref:Planctomycete cytochrome C n=1 Tax=Stieleria varia TaxID=2528005 RepID=A0A5C5ZYI2_9BACT|nr:PSD1 and planctomycete cytochrome C domain-containing protein [Stieleria varia]TWT92078.1 Planctomycete cytochrome C [Stieleria varia]